MEAVIEILEKINHSWNHYFWSYKFCQNKINFTEEIRTNYYGDILSYFNDTLNSLSNIEYEEEFQKSIYQAVGILQIIYTHQDLIDELLYIFKLPLSTREDKNPNRLIRNELIGHPIRRAKRGNKLISSVFFGKEFRNGTIHYILYSTENDFSGRDVIYKLDDIIERHKDFLLTYVRIVWRRIEVILKRFQKELTKLNILVNKNIEFSKLLSLVEQLFNKIFKENYLFKVETLTACYKRQKEHPRYKNTIQLFIDTLIELLPETIKNIDEIIAAKSESRNVPIPEIIVSYSATSEIIKSKDQDHLGYEFSKLMENHPIFGLDYFKRKFSKDNQLMEELLNMQLNVENDLEYYSSYEYLRILLTNRRLLNSA